MRHPIRGLVRAVLVFEWGVLTTRIEPSDLLPKKSTKCYYEPARQKAEY